MWGRPQNLTVILFSWFSLFDRLFLVDDARCRHTERWNDARPMMAKYLRPRERKRKAIISRSLTGGARAILGSYVVAFYQMRDAR